jgi:hypothetical protein
MSSPSNSKLTEHENSSPPAARTLPPPHQEPEYPRGPPVDLGVRLANARNLRPTEAPPAPSPRATLILSIADGGRSLLRPATSRLDTDMAFKPVPKYGGVPGSYRSPYDGGGRTPGDQHLIASSTTVEEFEAMYGTDARRYRAAAAVEDAASEGSAESDQTVGPSQPARTISFGMMPPVTIRDKGKAPVAPQPTQKVAPTVAEGVSFFSPPCACS